VNSDSTVGVSIVVPLLNEEAVAHKLIEHLATLDAEQIVIVDGGSIDATRRIMSDAGFQVLESPAGRTEALSWRLKVCCCFSMLIPSCQKTINLS